MPSASTRSATPRRPPAQDDVDPTPAVSARERLLESLLESVTDYAVVSLDMGGLVITWNEGARRLLGWTEAEMLGRPATALFTPEDNLAGILAAEMQVALQGGKAVDDRWMQRKDGTRFFAHGSLTPLRAPDGGILGFVKVLRDRTPEHLATERRLADAEFLASILASSGDCIKVLDLDARIVFMNDGGRQVMEVGDFNAIQGRPWPDFWDGDNRPLAADAVAAAKAGGTAKFQGVARTMAGNPKWWDVQVTPIRGSEGSPAKLLVVSRDITVTRLAEEALREAQGLNTLILNSSRDCIVVLDLDGRTQFVSAGGIAAMEVTDVDAVIGLSWLRVWAGSDHAAATAAVAEARAGRIGRFQGFCPTHAGTPKWWDVVISPLPGVDGRPERLVSVGRDITDLKQAEHLLALSKERLNLALGASGMVGIWDWDVAADLVYADSNSARLYRVDPAWAIAGAPLAEFSRHMHPDDLPEVRAALSAALAGGDDFSSEYRVEQSDGSVQWLVARGRLVRDADGRPVRLPGASVDITERKLAEQRQRLLMQELAHRVKNTLAVVQAIASQTLRGEGSLADARQSFTARLLALAQAHDVLLQGSWTEASLHGLVDGAVRLLGHDEAGRFRIDGDDLTLGPKAALSFALVLHELGTNAAKYGALSTPDGHVETTWRHDDTADESCLHFRWREVGGPPVSPPQRQGFGSRLIERSLTQGLGATVQLEYLPDGVTFTMTAPLGALQQR